MESTKLFEEKWARIFKAAGVEKDAELARILEIKAPSVSAARKRKQIPSGWVEKIAEKFEVSADWLFFGIGKKNRSTGSCDVDSIAVPKVKARLSAGTGSLETSGETKRFCYFRSDWIHRKCCPSRCVVMDVTGDSMEPLIRDKDIVLLDQGQTDIISGSIYAIGIEDEVLIKHVERVPGHYILRSANKNYDPINVDLKDESLNVRIIGRALWIGREL